MTVHPTVLSRYMRIQQTHRSVLPAGELTAERQIQASTLTACCPWPK